jgi:tetratricopeptide (TPR) repeat protein
MRIPEGVREVIGRRLNRLSQRCNQTLTIASVIGREFTLGQLKPLIEDITEDRLLEVLEEALAARVIEELPRAVGRYQFSHALIQETLVEELTLTRRVRLHARIAEALEQLYGNQAEGHAAELAHHFAEAQSVLGTEKLVHYSLLAGERALAAYGWEEAQAHFQRGLVAKEGMGAASGAPTVQAMDAEMAALLFGLGRAQAATAATLERHQMQQAVDNLRRAFDYYVQAGDVVRALAVAECPYPSSPGSPTGMAQLIARALTLVPPDSLQAGCLLSPYGHVLGVEEGDYDGAQEALSRALAIAQRVQDAGLELRTLAEAARVDGFQLRYQECLAKSLRAIELARRVDDLRSEVTARLEASSALGCLGDPEGARQHGAETLALAERLRDRYWLSSALFGLTSPSYFQGDWQAARDFSDRGLAVSATDPRILSRRTLLEYQVGDFAQGEVYLERLLEVMRLDRPGPTAPYAVSAVVVPTVARVTGDTSRLEVAQAAARTVLKSPSVTQRAAIFSRAGLGLLAVLREDITLGEEQYSVLDAVRGTMLFAIAGDRLLGLLAQTMGNLDKAAEHFEDALTFCRKAGYRPELAWTCCDYADTLLDPVGAALRGRPGHPHRGAPTDPANRAKAMALLDEALAISRELGMRPLMERVLSRREILTA